MRENFEAALAKVLVHEGGYVNHPADPGGATNRGVTQRVYDGFRKRRSLPTRSVRQISDVEVREIYRLQYWNAVRGDELPSGIDYVVFDGAVNSGPKQSVLWLQRALGVEADGHLGEATLQAVHAHRNHDELVAEICRRRMAFLKSLKPWPTFGKGWTARVSGVLKVGQAMATGRKAPPVPENAAGAARAMATDIDAPGEGSAAAADASIGIGTATTMVSSTATALEPVKDGSPVLQQLFVGLIMLGILLTIGGVLFRLWRNSKARRARQARDGEAIVSDDFAWAEG